MGNPFDEAENPFDAAPPVAVDSHPELRQDYRDAHPEPSVWQKIKAALEPSAETEAKVKDWAGTVGSGVKGAQSGLSMGFNPQLAGLGAVKNQLMGSPDKPERNLLPVGEQLSQYGHDLTPTALLDAYRQARDKEAADTAAAETANPKTFLAGDVAGSLALPVPGPGKAKGLARVGKFALQGAGLGSLSALGHSRADLTTADPEEWKKAGKDVATGAALGAPLGAVGGEVSTRLGNWLSNKAEDFAVKAAMPSAGITNRLRDMGKETPEEIRAMGREFIDNKLVPVFGGKEAMAEKGTQLMKRQGDAMDRVLDHADTRSEPNRFDFDEAADYALKNLDNISAVKEMASGPARALAEAFRAQGKKTPGSFRGASQAKSDAWGAANFSDKAPASKRLYNQVGHDIRADISRQLEEGAAPDAMMSEIRRLQPATATEAYLNELAGPGEVPDTFGRVGAAAAHGKAQGGQLRTDYDKANKLYGAGANAEELATEAATRERAKSLLSLPEMLALATAAGTAGSGHPGVSGGSLAAALALHAAKNRGYGPATHAAENMSKFVPHLPVAAQNAVPGEGDDLRSAWDRFVSDREEEKK